MVPPQLTDYKEFQEDLPDGRRITVHQVVPVSNNDYFIIPEPSEPTEGSSVVGFLAESDGGTIAAPNFYIGDEDRVVLINRKGQKAVITTINEGAR